MFLNIFIFPGADYVEEDEKFDMGRGGGNSMTLPGEPTEQRETTCSLAQSWQKYAFMRFFRYDGFFFGVTGATFGCRRGEPLANQFEASNNIEIACAQKGSHARRRTGV